MKNLTTDKYSAGEQSLGYIYQSRFALLKLLQLPEEVAICIEKDDDLDFVDVEGKKTLVSLKHKASGERLTDLSTDFWRSVRIWLDRYKRDGKTECSLRFFLFTTNEVTEDSFQNNFLPDKNVSLSIVTLADTVLSKSTSQVILPIRNEFDLLVDNEKYDFLSRIVIFDQSPRITDIPKVIMDQHMRTVRREFRQPVLERLEGWWNNLVIKVLTGDRTSEVFGYEVSDKLSAITEEFKNDNLPIDFRGEKPEGEIDPENDPRLFVAQLREIKILPNRIQSAIYDYYRAFEQRASWARENVLIDGEVENYENRLVEEWERYRDVIFEGLEEDSAEAKMIEAGKELYKWAEFNTTELRIRARVSEPYVVRGNFHILANNRPLPRIYWHPLFLERLDKVLKGASV